MHKSSISLRAIGTAFGLALAVAVFAAAQQPPSPEGKTAGEFYKNIKVLNDTPATELNAGMHLISGSLGVKCEYCHVDPGGFEKDDKPLKNTAREMMKMVQGLNKASFEGEQVVTCYTCHHGSPKPVGMPILPIPPYFEETPPPALPSADQILTKYIQALGGEQAIRKVTSRVITATADIPTGPGGIYPLPGQIEQYLKAPNLVLTVSHYTATTPTGTTMATISSGFDGNRSWTQDLRGRVGEALEIDQKRAKRGSDFYESVNLKKEYSKLEVTAKEKINGHDAYVVVGSVAGDLPEKLYFDVQSGLLLRKSTVLPTPVGLSPYEINYDDYRDTGSGVKFPYLMKMTPASSRVELEPISVMRVQKVQDNAPLENSKFTKPTPPPPPPAPPR